MAGLSNPDWGPANSGHTLESPELAPLFPAVETRRLSTVRAVLGDASGCARKKETARSEQLGKEGSRSEKAVEARPHRPRRPRALLPRGRPQTRLGELGWPSGTLHC